VDFGRTLTAAVDDVWRWSTNCSLDRAVVGDCTITTPARWVSDFCDWTPRRRFTIQGRLLGDGARSVASLVTSRVTSEGTNDVDARCFVSWESNSTSWPRKLKFGEIDGRLSLQVNNAALLVTKGHAFPQNSKFWDWNFFGAIAYAPTCLPIVSAYGYLSTSN